MKNTLLTFGMRSFFTVALVLLVLLASSVACFAHPMGNFSISHYSGIQLGKNGVEIRYIIDMAEIPTFQEMQQNALVAKTEDASARSYLAKQAEALKAGLVLTLNGQILALRAESADILFPPGAGGLPTLKMAFVYRANFQLQETAALGDNYALYYRDENFPNRVGWKEVIATAQSGVKMVSSSAPERDRSAELSNYPTDLLNSPPLDVEARLNFSVEQGGATDAAISLAAPLPSSRGSRSQVGGSSDPTGSRYAQATGQSAEVSHPSSTNSISGTASESLLRPNKQATPQNRFTQLMTANQFGLWFLVGAAAIAAGLGALHALEPGHGKTIVAAYLVGSKGTAYHAFILGLIVTASHTAGVYALGAITLYASRYIVPDQLYPWLGAISGLLIAALGSYLFLQRYAGHEIGHSHGPGGHHHHHHHGDEHGHTHSDGDLHTHHGHHHHEISGDVSMRQLLALGITGGIVPCPAALVVLLSAVALNRVGFGLFLIVAFSFGLAAVLIAVGMLMVYARKFMARFRTEGPMITRWLPLTSAAVITFLGLGIAIRSLVTGGILQIRV